MAAAHRFAYAPCRAGALFMVLVHLVPTAAGVYLSFLDLNTFTFSQLFGGARGWASRTTGAILFDDDEPASHGLHRRRWQHGVLRAWTVGGSPSRRHRLALLLNRQLPGQAVAGR